MITVLMIEPGEHPCIALLKPTMQAFNLAVSIGADEIGQAEAKHIGPDVYMIYNTDLYFAGLDGNRKIGKDILAGAIYVIGVNKRKVPRSLREDEIRMYMTRYWKPEFFSDTELLDANLDIFYQTLDDLEKLQTTNIYYNHEPLTAKCC